MLNVKANFDHRQDNIIDIYLALNFTIYILDQKRNDIFFLNKNIYNHILNNIYKKGNKQNLFRTIARDFV